MPTLPFQLYRWVDNNPVVEVGGIVRPISDPKSLAQYGITDFSSLPYHPATGMAGPVRGGTTGGGMALQDLINQQNVYTQHATGAVDTGGKPTQTPQTQVPTVQPAPQPIQQPAQQPAQPSQPTGKYVQYAGSPDIFDASGRYISAQEAASIPNFQSQVQQIATPRPDIKVESDFAKLAGQNITQMVKEAVAPATPVQQPTTAQPEAPKLPQGAEVTTGSSQKPYVQYEGSPDVFERATGKYISGEEAQKIPDFFSQVEKATSVRPGVTTEEDFAKLAKTNLQLQQSGATTTEQDFKTNPLKAFQDTYRQIWDNLGLSNVKKQIEDTLKAKNEVNNEMIDKIAEVNDNPWISEAERSRQITKLTNKYEQKNAANVESLKLLQGVFEMGQQEAQFVTTNALNAFNQQQTFDQQILLKQMDLAEKLTDVSKNIREVNGGLYNTLTNKWIVAPKATSSEYKPPTSYQEWELAGKPVTYADWLKEQNIKAPTTAQQTVAEYAARIEQASPILNSLEKTISNMNFASFEAQVFADKPYLQSDNIQQYMQAARNFINAKLRRESGAVISPTEFIDARKQYLPVPGDTEAALKQKKDNRDLVYASLKKAAGNAYQSVDELLGKQYTPGTVISENGIMYIVENDGETLTPIGSAQ